MKGFAVFLTMMVLVMGCARVSVQGSKEPIKLDISMRLDIYQHVQKDIDDIESLVSGSKEAGPAKDQRGFLRLAPSCAYAQDALGPDVEQAALRRKDRLSSLHSLEAAGLVGENARGLVQARGALDAAAQRIIDAENADRMVIYKAVAAKNGIALEEVQTLYAKRLREDAPAGTPVEVADAQGSGSQWKFK